MTVSRVPLFTAALVSALGVVAIVAVVLPVPGDEHRRGLSLAGSDDQQFYNSASIEHFRAGQYPFNNVNAPPGQSSLSNDLLPLGMDS